MLQRRIKKRLFTLGINNRLWWSDHKWTAETDCCLHRVFTSVSNVSSVTTSDQISLWPGSLISVTYNVSVLLLADKVAKVNPLLQMWCFGPNDHCCFSTLVQIPTRTIVSKESLKCVLCLNKGFVKFESFRKKAFIVKTFSDCFFIWFFNQIWSEIQPVSNKRLWWFQCFSCLVSRDISHLFFSVWRFSFSIILQ